MRAPRVFDVQRGHGHSIGPERDPIFPDLEFLYVPQETTDHDDEHDRCKDDFSEARKAHRARRFCCQRTCHSD